MKLSFDEVKDIFMSYLQWCGGKEIHWYRKAWALLEKGGLISYENILKKI